MNKAKMFNHTVKKEIIVEYKEPGKDFTWESLLYANNIENFGHVTDGKTYCTLTTSGNVRVINKKTGKVYKNTKLPDDLIRLLKAGDYDSVEARYEIAENNWFVFLIGDILEDGSINYYDDVVFEQYPGDSFGMKHWLSRYFDDVVSAEKEEE